ncbi:MAG TPA: ATP-binding protein [Verrucomicrobiae bacterium]|nr:ATP-binding protein [Verrucomicrobiae bacterium]
MSTRTLRAPHRDLAAELEETRARLAQAEETLEAIRNGEVDALVVSASGGEQIFSLQGAETPYRCLIERMHEGALLLNPQATILYANAHFAQLARRPLEQLIGSSWSVLLAPGQYERLEGLLRGAKGGGIRGEFQLRLPEGGYLPVEVSLSSIPIEPAGALAAIVTDLSERKAAETRLVAANKELKEMVGELQHVSYAVVHDIRAPLRAMEGFAALLEGDLGLTPAERKDYCRRIAAAASRLDKFIQDILTYNKAVLELPPLARVALSRVVQGVLESYPHLSRENADIEVAEQLPVVLGNETLLIQCFSNLLGNAVKFVRRNTRPRVRIWAEPSGRMAPEDKSESSEVHLVRPARPVRIWIEDNGIGISKSARHRLFGMFQRLHPGYEGTGIGLAIVRKVVNRMGGRVGVKSVEGEGSRFWVELQEAS